MSKKSNHNQMPYKEMSTWELIRMLIISRLPRQKEKMSDEALTPLPKLKDEEVTHIAIVLDGVVEDVMRAQNRLAALVLSKPDFIEFDPRKDKPQIGETKYADGKFIYPTRELMSDDEIQKTLEDMGVKKDNED